MTVSILIPAFRPTFLGQAIASVLAQGEEDFELIVSDDSGGDDVLAVVERFRDPRIRYVTTAGRVGARENMRALWREAKHEVVKFLYDDDLIMPHNIGLMLDEIRAFPELSFVFGIRHIINERGRIVHDGQTFAGNRIQVDRGILAQNILRRLENSIGEFSNVLINRAHGLTEEDFLTYQGLEMHVCADVGFFLNAARRGPCMALGRLTGAFRRHAEQNSKPEFNPWFPVGICEWEMFIRGELTTGLLPAADALLGIERLRVRYEDWSSRLPVIATMRPGLEILAQRVRDGERQVLDEAFREQWRGLIAHVRAEAKQWSRSPGQAAELARTT